MYTPPYIDWERWFKSPNKKQSYFSSSKVLVMFQSKSTLLNSVFNLCSDTILCLICTQVQLPVAGLSGLELPSRPFPRGGETNPVQGLWHQVRHHRPRESRWEWDLRTETKSILTNLTIMLTLLWFKSWRRKSQESLIWRTQWSTLLLDSVSSASSPCSATSSSSTMSQKRRL